MVSWSVLFLLLSLVFASPLGRRDEVCGQYDSVPVPSGSYELLTNLWGLSPATSGSQCSALQGVDGDVVKWRTNWHWDGGRSVKSFSNIQRNAGINQPLSAISTMPSEWQWSQENTGTVVSDVAYDLFTAYSPGGYPVNEVMIWVAEYNAGPISYEYDYGGTAIPIATSLSITGYTWKLFRGSNGYNLVYSFVSEQGNIASFSGDIYEFFSYLIDAGYVDASEYLVIAQAGTEAVSGTAVFETSYYQLTIA